LKKKKRHLEKEIRQVWQEASNKKLLSDDESEELLSNIQNRLAENKPVDSPNIGKRYLPAVAASIALLILSAVAIILLNKSNDELANGAYPSLVQKTTKADERNHLRLLDGTEVWLNVNSGLTYQKQFEGDKRLVKLTGEAYFKVAKNPSKPFIIETDRSVTEVLGTEFNLSSYPGQDINLSVTEGRVSFRSMGRHESNIALGANDLAHLDIETGKLQKRSNIDTRLYRGWMMEKLVFEDERIDKILAVLESRYLTNISMGDAGIGACTMNITVEHQSLQRLMEMIAISINGKFEMNKNGILLIGSSCATR